MSRIQEALAKMQSSQKPIKNRGDDSKANSPKTDLDVTAELKKISSERYLGARIAVDFDALEAAGLLPPAEQARQLQTEFKSIKRPILRNMRAADPAIRKSNLWMVTSSLAGEGKTFTSINLAMSLALEKEYEVVLVDGDCGKGHLTSVFDASQQLGLLDLIRDDSLTFESVVMPTDVEGLSFLPLGRVDDHVAELFSSSRMDSLTEFWAVSDPNRIFVFDSPPLLLTAESPILAAQVGQVALVVRAMKTSRQAVHDAYDRLNPDSPTNLILTHANSRESVNAYGSYYGYNPSE